jgi:hypothetical protein
MDRRDREALLAGVGPEFEHNMFLDRAEALEAAGRRD